MVEALNLNISLPSKFRMKMYKEQKKKLVALFKELSDAIDNCSIVNIQNSQEKARGMIGTFYIGCIDIALLVSKTVKTMKLRKRSIFSFGVRPQFLLEMILRISLLMVTPLPLVYLFRADAVLYIIIYLQMLLIWAHAEIGLRQHNISKAKYGPCSVHKSCWNQ